MDMRFDVVVIGGGGAALRAAYSAWQNGAKTAILCKKEASRSGATYYSVAEVGAFNVPDGSMDPTDSPEAFYRDMEEASLRMARLPLCRLLAERAEDALKDLEEIGAGSVFSKKDGKYNVYQACFSTKPRSHVIENHFKPILKALGTAVAKTDVTVLNDMQAVDLLTSGGEIGGVLAQDAAGEPVMIRAKSVILACGGASRLFRRNMYPADITGDGYAMAYRAGAQLSNMEFIQAGIGVAHPFINLFGNYLWKAFPTIRNARGEDILLKYGGSPQAVHEAEAQKTHFPFSSRDASRLIEIAVQKEIIQGNGTERGNVYLDFLHTDFDKLLREAPDFASMWRFTYDWHKEKGIDLYREPIEISCFAHAINGGVLIDEYAESSVPGLYAAGEVASGPHGADRLGGNMSVTCQVFGKIAGVSAAQRAKGMASFPDVERSFRELNSRRAAKVTGVQQDLAALTEQLQDASDKALLIVRDEAGLKGYLETLDVLRQETARGCTAENLGALLQLENLIASGEMIASAALERRESRGSHYRADYPEMDDAYGSPIILQHIP